MILLIDNYDSFSYNLYQMIGSVNPDIQVIRNDELTLAEIDALRPEKIILSPGPGKPFDAGVCVGAVSHFAGKYRFWAFASVIRQFAKPMVQPYLMLKH